MMLPCLFLSMAFSRSLLLLDFLNNFTCTESQIQSGAKVNPGALSPTNAFVEGCPAPLPVASQDVSQVASVLAAYAAIISSVSVIHLYNRISVFLVKYFSYFSLSESPMYKKSIKENERVGKEFFGSKL